MEAVHFSPPTRYFCVTISDQSLVQVFAFFIMASPQLQVMCLLIVISRSATVGVSRQRRLLWSVSVIPTWANTMLLWWFSHINHLFAQLLLVFLNSDTEKFVNRSESISLVAVRPTANAKLLSISQKTDLNANICGSPGSRAYHSLSLYIYFVFLS